MAVVALAPAGLSENLRRLIQAETLFASALQVARREVVYSGHDGDTSIYLVESGQVKSVIPARDGKECLLAIYTAGDMFGESCLLGDARLETVTAMTRSSLRRISGARVLAALTDAGLREELVKYLARRVFEQQLLITDLITADSEARLAAVLLTLARKLGRRQGPLLFIDQRITQEELSGMVGTTRSRVGFFLKRFRDARLVARAKGSFLVVHEPRLSDFLHRV